MTIALVPFLATLLLVQDPQPQHAQNPSAQEAQSQDASAQKDQNKEPKQIVESVQADFMKEARALDRPDRNDPDAIEKWNDKIQSMRKDKASKALKDNADVLSKGSGLYYRAQLQLMADDLDAAEKSLNQLVDNPGDSDMVDEAKLMLVQIQEGPNPKRAVSLFESIDSKNLDDDMKRMYDQMASSIDALKKRAELVGSQLPDIPVVATVNAPDDFSFANQKGKVLVLDFWATWCPPCRMIIPELVKAQKEMGDDVQFVGVTRYYGSGMDFSGEDATVPHGGESKRGLSKEEELEINRTFAKKFDMNYPIVITEDDVAGKQFGITGIPTVFVVNPQGKVVGSVVGAGDQSHEQLMKLIEQARQKNGD